jgi:hypothetical protein
MKGTHAWLIALAAGLLLSVVAPLKAGESVMTPLTPEEEAIVEKLRTPPSQAAVPDENNAAVIYRQLFDAAREEYFSEERQDEYDAVLCGEIRGTKSALPEPIPLESGESSNDGKPYRLLYKVVGMDCNFGVDWTDGPLAELPHLWRVRELAEVMALQVRFDCEQGRGERAVRHAAIIFKLAEDFSDEPCTVSSVFPRAVEMIGQHALLHCAIKYPRDPAFLKAASALVAARPKWKLTRAEIM